MYLNVYLFRFMLLLNQYVDITDVLVVCDIPLTTSTSLFSCGTYQSNYYACVVMRH